MYCNTSTVNGSRSSLTVFPARSIEPGTTTTESSFGSDASMTASSILLRTSTKLEEPFSSIVMLPSTAYSPVTSSPSIRTTSPACSTRMPERCHVSLKRTAWAASRLASSSPPSSQPPGYGKLPGTCHDVGTPKKICPNLTSNWNGIHTIPDRKYSLTTVQMPESIWARVPKKISTNDSTKRTTVRRSEATA